MTAAIELSGLTKHFGAVRAVDSIDVRAVDGIDASIERGKVTAFLGPNGDGKTTNGLDPEGIRWLRSHVRTLAGEGRTILPSSQARSEVEQTADHLLLIARARLIRSSTLADSAATSFGSGALSRSTAAIPVVGRRSWRGASARDRCQIGAA